MAQGISLRRRFSFAAPRRCSTTSPSSPLSSPGRNRCCSFTNFAEKKTSDRSPEIGEIVACRRFRIGAAMKREEILLLGDPRLREVCSPIEDFDAPEIKRGGRRLLRALEQFRAEFGFGRAISAPQIGFTRRMIAMNLGEGPFLLINPVLQGRGVESFTLWDDCMSFPWLLVRLERQLHVDLTYHDEKGKRQSWNNSSQTVSELLQHEVDHLDGILALDRALDRNSIISRKVYEEKRELFDRVVDYRISPTIS
jgi:peptide deformylase